MKPFLLLQIRDDETDTRDEAEAIMHFGDLCTADIEVIRVNKTTLPEINLDNYSGIIIGGGPYNVGDSLEKKPENQKRFESELEALLQRAFDADFPTIGLCYGMGVIADACNTLVSRNEYAENAGPVTIELTPEAQNDPLLEGLPKTFRAFTGHKDSCESLPENAVLLATSPQCPIQMFRLKENIYGVQFHPELDTPGIIKRLQVYKYSGYFPPNDIDLVIENCKREEITEPQRILAHFTERYART